MDRNGFPRHDIDPRNKDDKWILKCAKAIWSQSKTFSHNVFFHGRHRFREYRDYSNGRQSVEQYKNSLYPADKNGVRPEQFQQLDFSIIPIIPKFKKIALGKINKIGYNIVATAIDALARDEEEEYFAEQKAIIRMMDELGDISGIETMVGMEEDTPRTLEELRIKQEYSYKHTAAIEAEKGLKLLFTNNKYDQILAKVKEDLFDFGVGGVREYFDENGKIKIRHSKMQNFVSSYCEEDDFSDASYMGEVIYMTISDIRAYGEFTEKELEDIAKRSGRQTSWSRNSYNSRIVRDYDDDKIPVLDFEIKSFNETVFEKRIDKYGSTNISKTDFYRNRSRKKDIIRDGKHVIYKGKWVIDSPYVFDYGLCTNMKRKKNSLKDTDFSWHVMAPNQDQMKFFGVVESMVPVADQIQITWLKMQALILKAVPSGVAFDLSALDNINLGHGGEAWNPRQALELYWQRGDFVYRSQSEEGVPERNQAPVHPLQNQMAQEVNNFLMLINGFMGLMRDNIGFNEITDGSTPDPRTLNGVANLAYQSTTNALNHIIQGIKFLNENVSDALVVRMQDAFSAGNKAYLKALGINSQRFWKVESDISVHELSVKLEDRPDDEAVARLDAKINLALERQEITIADSCYIDTIDNIKEKAAVLGYLVKRNMEQKQAEQMQQIQANAESQQQSALVAEEEKRKTLEHEYDLKTQYMTTEKQMTFQIEEMKMRRRLQEAELRETGRITTKQVENEGKERIKAIERSQSE